MLRDRGKFLWYKSGSENILRQILQFINPCVFKHACGRTYFYLESKM